MFNLNELLVKTFGDVAQAGAAAALAQRDQPQTKKKKAGCTPCAARANALAAKERVKNGRL